MPGPRGFKAFKIRIKSLQIRQIINPVRSEAHGVTDKLAPDHAFDPALRGGIRHGKKQLKATALFIVFGVTQSVNLWTTFPPAGAR